MTLPRRLANAVYFRIWACLFFRGFDGLCTGAAGLLGLLWGLS